MSNPVRGAARATLVAAALVLALIAATGAAPAPAAASDAPWETVETYYLRLLNCTRTGGWVLKDGTCRGYGSGRYSDDVAPLRLSAGISDVARAWARKLVLDDRCVHGDPGARLRRAGYTSFRWAENIGCRDGYASAKAAVLATHRYFQSEKSYNGGHWRNLKNRTYKVVGIGVWRAGNRTRLVTDFYAP